MQPFEPAQEPDMQTRIIKADHIELALVTHKMRKLNPEIGMRPANAC